MPLMRPCLPQMLRHLLTTLLRFALTLGLKHETD
jgi:hypothetical protein